MVRAIYCDRAAQHLNPVPNAAIHNGLLITSGILGKELDTGKYPADKDRQIKLAFDYLEAILSEAGATIQDVVKLDLYFADKADRELANPYWLRLYPDPSQRPARQAHQSILPDGCCIQLVATAMVQNQS
ncbi:MAG: RidA family protein [Pseudomonadota bacterium]